MPSEMIERFESALGRSIKWSFGGGAAKRACQREEEKEKDQDHSKNSGSLHVPSKMPIRIIVTI